MENINDETLEQNEIQENEEFSAPAKVEKISLTEISEEIEKQEDEKSDALVKKIMDQILKID